LPNRRWFVVSYGWLRVAAKFLRKELASAQETFNHSAFALRL
jgi:hypothetical protein